MNMLPKDIWLYVVQPFLMISKEDVKRQHEEVMEAIRNMRGCYICGEVSMNLIPCGSHDVPCGDRSCNKVCCEGCQDIFFGWIDWCRECCWGANIGMRRKKVTRSNFPRKMPIGWLKYLPNIY